MSGASSEITRFSKFVKDTASSILLYLGVIEHVQSINVHMDNSDAKQNAEATDLEFLISQLLVALAKGEDNEAYKQFLKDFERTDSVNTPTKSCVLTSDALDKQKTLEALISSFKKYSKNEKVIVVLYHLNQSVGNHALNFVLRYLQQQEQFCSYVPIQNKISSKMYNTGDTYGLYYRVPVAKFISTVNSSNDLEPEVTIEAHFRTMIDGETCRVIHDIKATNHDLCTWNTSLISLFMRKIYGQESHEMTDLNFVINDEEEDWSLVKVMTKKHKA